MKKRELFFVLIFSVLTFASCKNTENALIFYTKALDYYQTEDLEKSGEFIDLCIKQDSSFYQAKFLKAKILYFSNNYNKSYNLLYSLVKKYPRYTDARIWKIRLLIALDRLEEAEKELNKELSFNNSDWRVYYQYSLLSDKLAQMDKRLIMLNKAEFFLSQSYNVYIESADVWIKLGLRNEALTELDKAISISTKPEELIKLRTFLKQGKDIQ